MLQELLNHPLKVRWTDIFSDLILPGLTIFSEKKLILLKLPLLKYYLLILAYKKVR
jgi:hypothetical protein